MGRRSRSSGGASAGSSPKRLRRSDRDVGRSRSLRDAALGGADQNGRRVNVTDGELNERNAALKVIDATEDSALKALSADFLESDNRSAHHTDDYEDGGLIVRRGQEFSVSVSFSREYNTDADSIILQLTTGPCPQESKDTLLRLPVSGSAHPEAAGDWCATLVGAEGTTAKVSVRPAADAIIGRYHTYIETLTKGDGDVTYSDRRDLEKTFIVLFNPWCEDDQAFLSDDAQRQEYVLNDHGRLWQGTAASNFGTPWNFGQFEDVVLEAALYLLDKAELSDGARSNPTQITRCISAMANSSDGDRGVLTGRWTDDYPKSCTVPWAWTGSVAILDEYMRTKKAVRYGQCWVFSGLVTTLLRSLGLATRSVTNFESAHDCDASITIDYHWNEDDEPETDLNDSVWNFHVWNESFFGRPDLPAGYGGWQAHDATPQEASEGVMRCGPAPLKAIKEGHVYLPYDAPFIMAEVNGDKVHWLIKKDGSMEVLCKEKNAIGMSISTKAVGSNERHDLTLDYKYKEGSPEERAAVHRAFRYSSRREHRVYDLPDPDVTFTLTSPDAVTLGDPFTLAVSAQNTSDERRTVTIRMTCVTSYYTGVPSERIGTKVFSEEFAPGEVKTADLEITAADYAAFLKPESMVTVYMKGHVVETKKAYAQTKSFQVLKPSLKLQVPDSVSIGEPFSLSISFTNPLEEKLTGGVFHIEAARITKPLVIPYKKVIAPRAEVQFEVPDLVPSRSGNREIAVNFSSDQLTGLSGAAEVYVSYGAR